MASDIQVVGIRFEDENAEFLKAMKEKNGLSKNKIYNMIVEDLRNRSNGQIPEIVLVGKAVSEITVNPNQEEE